jgi:hypothetical protein
VSPLLLLRKSTISEVFKPRITNSMSQTFESKSGMEKLRLPLRFKTGRQPDVSIRACPIGVGLAHHEAAGVLYH